MSGGITMVGSQKSLISLQYNVGFWVFVERAKCIYNPLRLVNMSSDVVKKAMICLENDDVHKAVWYLNKAKKLIPDHPEVLVLDNIIQMRIQNHKENDTGFS